MAHRGKPQTGQGKSLIPAIDAEPQVSIGTGRYKYAFMHNKHYLTLRPYLRPEVVKQLEGELTTITKGDPPFPRKLIVEEIERIAKEWDVV